MESPDLSKIVRERLLALGVDPGDRCLVALSGGQDSTALLAAMLCCWDGGMYTAAAHVDHAVRSGSSEDLKKVENLCEQLGVELMSCRLDPEEISRAVRRTGSLEAALRKFRYEFLHLSARSWGAKWLLTGHTADDQVETVLFRILRKMNVMALSGIPEKRSGIVRPLLGVSRDMTLRYCLEQGIEPLLDSSNRDQRFARNRIRHYTIPALEATFHPGLKRLLLHMSSVVSRLNTVENATFRGFAGSGLDTEKGIISIEHVSALHRAVKEQLIGRFMHTMTGRWPSRYLVEAAVKQLISPTSGRLSLPGGLVMDSDGQNVYIKKPEAKSTHTLPDTAVCLPVPGRVGIGGVTLTTENKILQEPFSFPAGNSVLIRKNQLQTPLWVRRRLSGDRFNPLGMDETKKLKEFFIDRKIPRSERDHIPLVLDNNGEILWVAGVEISQKVALKGHTGEKAVLVRMERKSDVT